MVTMVTILTLYHLLLDDERVEKLLFMCFYFNGILTTVLIDLPIGRFQTAGMTSQVIHSQC